MKSLQEFAWKLVIALVIIFGGGWLLGMVFNIAALLSPQMVTKVECPDGSTVKEEWVQMSWDEPGQKTLTFQCLDQNGKSVPTLTDEQTKEAGYKYFTVPGFIVMAVLVVGWFIWSAFKGMHKAKAHSSTA